MSITIDEAERQQFIAWTFDNELSRLEDLLGSEFDRNSPTADVEFARFAVTLESEGEDNSLPIFLGHDMIWWSGMCRERLLRRGDDELSSNGQMWSDGTYWHQGPCLLDHLGIRQAVLDWIAAQNAWLKRRRAARRAATKAGRNLLAEWFPKVL
jgi:hypothetical protein